MKKRPFLCVGLLETFSEKEKKGLNELASCRYFSTDRYVLRLLEVLRKDILGKRAFVPELQSRVYGKVFTDFPKPGKFLKKKESSLLSAKMTALTRLAERFLAIEQMEEGGAYKREFLYERLLERKQFRLFSRHDKREMKKQEEQVAKDREYYAHSHKMELHRFDYFYRSGKLVEEDNINEVMYHLDLYFLLYKLGFHLSMLSLKATNAKKRYELSSIEAIKSLLELPQYVNHPLIVLHRANIQLLETQSEEAYHHLLELLERYESVTPLNLLKNFYLAASNYCSRKIRLGDLDYYRHMFDLHQIMVDKNLLAEDGYIPVNTFKNIVVVACKVSEFEWATNFVENYDHFIQESFRESVLNFNLGMIAFQQKDYETAHGRFFLVEPLSVNYDTNVRTLILKCLYENGKEYREEIVQSFRNTGRYFENHKSLAGNWKKSYKNFIQILTYLYRIRHRATKMNLQRVKDKLAAQKFNNDRQWLLEKIAELEKRRY